MKIEMTGQLLPCEICAQAKIRHLNIPKKNLKQVPNRPGFRIFIDISSFQHESMGGKRHWLIAVDEFSDCSHSFFLKRKSDQTIVIPIWIKGLNNKHGIDAKRNNWTTVEKIEVLTENAQSDTFKAPCCCFEYPSYTALTIV